MARYKQDDRLSAFQYCAKELDWIVYPKDELGLIKWLLDFKLFKAGSGKQISPMIITRENDLHFTCAFDYCYTISTGKSSATFRQTVFFRYSKELALPHFILVPEKWYHRLGTYFGMQDIDFVEYPEFSQNYLLRGQDEDYIRHHFNHPEMIRYFKKQEGFSIEGMNYLLILYRHNVVLPAGQIRKLIEIGNTLHNYLSDKTPTIELPPGGDFVTE